MFENYKDHDIAVYAGYIYDEKKLMQSSSGGIATALYEKFISEGGYVVGVKYKDDFSGAEYTIVKDIKDIAKLKGSKYIEPEKNNIYKKVKELLLKGEKVLFIGLPCVVGSLLSYLKEDYKQLTTCTLVCHGTTSPKVHTQYLNYLEKKFNGKIIDFSVKYKRNAWTPIYLRAVFDNGEIFEKEFYQTEYGIGFTYYVKPSCYNCKFKGNNRPGDMMIGDYWGSSDKDAYWNEKGVSVIFIHTQKGLDLINQVNGIKLFDTKFEDAVAQNMMVINSCTSDETSVKFKKEFDEKGLFYASQTVIKELNKKKLFNASLPVRFVRKIRAAVKKLVPVSLIKKLRG